MKTKPESEVVPVAYITKYALTKGIIEVHGWRLSRSECDPQLPYLVHPTSSVRGFYSHRDWTADRDVAIARAHEMASRRAKSLIKQADAMKSYKATFRLLSSDQE